MSLLQESIQTLHNKLQSHEIKPSDLAQESIQRIRETDEKLGTYLYFDEQRMLEDARKLDEIQMRVPAADLAPLFGIPAGIKDNLVTKGIPTTCASKILEGYLPPYTATAVKKLEDQGYLLAGKTNMDEFAMGSSNENSAYFPARNPWDVSRVPGGSSGGSAVTVAAGQVVFALGSDTGGSIRQPAAYCGVVGLKPTYGLVSRFGLVAFASSLDQIGPLTHSVADAAYVLQAIAGRDSLDSTSAPVEIPDYTKALHTDVNGLRIGIPQEYFHVAGADPEVIASVRTAISVLQSAGAIIEEVSLPHTQYALAAYYLLAPAEASSNLARFDGVRYGRRSERAETLIEMYKNTRAEGFGQEVKRRIMLGTYALSSGYYDAYYLRAQKVRTLVKQDFDAAFTKVDVILSPTAPTVAFESGQQLQDPLTVYLNDIYTIPVNLAGLPAISVPCGLLHGLPVGLQLIGKSFDESTLLSVAHAYEQLAGLKLQTNL